MSGIRVRGTRPSFGLKGLLGGSWVLSRVLSGVTIPITHIRGLIKSLITTPEPPGRV